MNDYYQIVRFWDKIGLYFGVFEGERLQEHVRLGETFAKNFLYKKCAPSLVGMVRAFLVWLVLGVLMLLYLWCFGVAVIN